jgi:hypothetical protein
MQQTRTLRPEKDGEASLDGTKKLIEDPERTDQVFEIVRAWRATASRDLTNARPIPKVGAAAGRPAC